MKNKIALKDCEFNQDGFNSKGELKNSKTVTIYQSKTNISSLGTYVGDASIHIPKSKSIPKNFHNDLSNYKGIVSVGRTQTKNNDGSNTYAYQNVHFYSSGCETLDGYRRICYLYHKNDEDFLRVKECARSQGDSYSAYYKLLESELLQNNFETIGSDFKITAVCISLFINILNEINQKSLENKYQLVLFNEMQIVKLKYYHTVYWDSSTPAEACDCIKPTSEKMLKDLFDYINTENDSSLLLKISKSLTEMLRLISIKNKFL
ncbi:MAG: hypothetical protein JJE21_02185 [Spirochaetaceae bacterium]|nr:hypothetical protein [Spirochaetaceae bacterium]